MQEYRITITLFDTEREALFRLARHERRDTRGQAAVIIRDELLRRGLLNAGNSPLNTNKPNRSKGNPPAADATFLKLRKVVLSKHRTE